MSKDNIKEPLTIQEHGFFTSMKSLEDVMDYMTKYGGKENAYLCAMTQAFTINTIVRMMEIYDYNKVSDIKDGYLEEKTKKYYDGGAGFASALGTPYLTTLGGILRERSES